MQQYGIVTTTPVAQPSPEVDRFKSPRPVFQAPQNAVHIAPKVKDNTPAPSLASQAHNAASDKVKAALLAASEAAKTVTPDTYSSKPRQRKAKVETPVTKVSTSVPQFGPEDVCPDDATFIKKTRDGNYHTPEMKRIFWANGGERHMVAGLTYAQAFSNLRTEKMRNLRK